MEYQIEEIINIEQLDRLMSKFIAYAGIGTAILDLKGNVLQAAGWQDICTKFHRLNSETCKRCIESDVALANELKKGQKYNIYKCLNGMVDVAVPIYINNEHVLNLFIGQVLISKPDIKFFKSQAEKYGFNEGEYLKALSKVAIVPENEIKKISEFLIEIATYIGEAGYDRLKLQGLTKNQEKIIQDRTKDLKESEKRWKFALEGAGDGLWDWNLKTDELYFSKKWKTMLGYDPDDLENGFSTWGNLIHPDDKEKSVSEFTSYLEGKISFYENEQRLRRKDGSYCWILDRGKVVEFDEDGKPLRFIGTHADISKIKRIQEELDKQKRAAEELNVKLSEMMVEIKRSNEELEQFAYVASHDLQEPLRMVSSYTQLLANKYKGNLDEKADTYIHFAVDGATRMQTLINNLLDYSRIATRGEPFKLIDCHKVLAEALTALKNKIEESNAIVTIGELPEIYCDESQLSRVFLNLIGNAIKFRTDKTPMIHVSAEEEKNAWRFEISDNGLGIDPKYNEKIFVIFQRLHSRQEYEGTGIGLSICKRIINRHKGNIWIESKLGEGTTFFFTIPKK